MRLRRGQPIEGDSARAAASTAPTTEVGRRGVACDACLALESLAKNGCSAAGGFALGETLALGCCDIVDPGLAGEMGILGPERGTVGLGHRIDDTVGQGEVLLQPESRRFQSQIGIEVDRQSLLHRGDDLERRLFAPLAADDFEDFVEADDGHDQSGGVLDGRSKMVGAGFVREIGEPSR